MTLGMPPVQTKRWSRREYDRHVAVVRRAPRDYAAAHPSDPVLVVEVARSSLEFVADLLP